MKVLFAVSNESVSESIVKKYQQMYKEIILSKNVYYVNAILNEIQKDKTYDRIVISEDSEPLTNNKYETIDNFIKCLRKVTDKKGKLKLEITPNELADFIETIKSITLSMAEKNNVATENLNNSLEETVIMFDVEHLLEIQKNMIRKRA